MSTPKRLSGSSVLKGLKGLWRRSVPCPPECAFGLYAGSQHMAVCWMEASNRVKLADDFDAARAEGKE